MGEKQGSEEIREAIHAHAVGLVGELWYAVGCKGLSLFLVLNFLVKEFWCPI